MSHRSSLWTHAGIFVWKVVIVSISYKTVYTSLRLQRGGWGQAQILKSLQCYDVRKRRFFQLGHTDIMCGYTFQKCLSYPKRDRKGLLSEVEILSERKKLKTKKLLLRKRTILGNKLYSSQKSFVIKILRRYGRLYK